MIVSSPRIEGEQVSAVLTSHRGDFEIRYTLPPSFPVTDAANGFFIAGLLPAMAKPRRSDPEPFRAQFPGTKPAQVEQDGYYRSLEPVSPRLLQAIPQIQDIVLAWDRRVWAIEQPKKRRLQRIVVDARPADKPSFPSSGLGSASFFTAGVDSFYTALKHADEIEALIYVRGFEYLERPGAFEKAREGVRKAAAGLGKPLIELATNLPSVSAKFLSWGSYNGAALASAAAMLSDRFRRVFIAATNTYDNIVPMGTHPLLDPLWSTERTEIIHDGCEATRIEKLAAIADNETVQSQLRVCTEQPDQTYNCSSCEKCLRTMIYLRVLGKLGQFKTFGRLDPARMTFVCEPRATAWAYGWNAILSSLAQSGSDSELQAGIKRMLERFAADALPFLNRRRKSF